MNRLTKSRRAGFGGAYLAAEAAKAATALAAVSEAPEACPSRTRKEEMRQIRQRVSGREYYEVSGNRSFFEGGTATGSLIHSERQEAEPYLVWSDDKP